MVIASPSVMFAAGIDGLFDTAGSLIGKAQLLIVGLVSLVFFYGLFKFVFGKTSGEGDKKVGKDFMVWSVVAIFLMASIWGIVRVLQDTVFNGDDTSQIHVPVYKYTN